MSEQALIDNCLNELTEMAQLIRACSPSHFDSDTLAVCMQTMDGMKQVATRLASAELIHIAESASAVLMDMTDAHYVKHDVAPALLTALEAMKVTLLSRQEKLLPDQQNNTLIVEQDIASSDSRVWQITIVPKASLFQHNSDVIAIYQQLASLGELAITTDLTQLPPFFDYDPEHCYVSWQARLTAEVMRTDIADILSQLATVADYQLTLITPQQTLERQVDEFKAIDHQNEMANLQQVLNNLAAIRHQLQAIDPQQRDVTQMTLHDVTERLITLTQDMQSNVLNMSMASSETLFQAVIDECHLAVIDTHIDTRIVGSHVVLARSQYRQLQALVSALTHYIIEYHINVENRPSLGKVPVAMLSFSARIEQQYLQLQITDDGCGQNNADATAQAAMKALESTIEALGGTITISHQLGESSQHLMTFPMQQTLLEGQVITVADHHYIVPLAAIIATQTYENKELDTVIEQGEVYLFEDDYLPVIRLQDELGLECDEIPDVVMVVELDGVRAACLISDVLGQQTVMMTHLETHYHSVTGVAGAAVLNNGQLVLILDLATLMAPSSSRHDKEPS